MKTIGFETCKIQDRDVILVVDHDENTVKDVLDARALRDWLQAHEGEEAEHVFVDLVPEHIEVLREAFPGASLQVYRNAVPHLVGAEEIRRMEAEYGEDGQKLGIQRHMAAARFAFDERQLSIAGGKLTLRFVGQDLKLPPDKMQRLNKLFDFCQHFLLPDPALREHVEAFLDSPEAAGIPESAALIREYIEEICPAEDDPALSRPLHLVKDTWLKQVERGDEETAVSFDEVKAKILEAWSEDL